MIPTTSKKDFLISEVGELFKKVDAMTKPAFGLMTPQHMVEHLVVTIKTSVKRYGEPNESSAKRAAGFRRFIDKGAIFEHRPSSKTKADLPVLKYDSLEEAVEQLPIAINRFYDHFERNPDFKSFNPFMGELNFEDLELFHYQHVRYHLWQFGALKSYP